MHWIVVIQVLLLLLMAGISAAIGSRVIVISVLAGGITAIIPQLYFARLAFRHTGAQSTAAMAKALFRGESGKFLLAAAMFALVFGWVRPIHAPSVFAAYFIMIVVQLAGAAKLVR